MLAFSPPSDAAASIDHRASAGGIISSHSPRAERPEPPAGPGRRLALRRMRPARRVEVETVGERPVRVEARLVVASAGPWRASGEWWDREAWARDEWDVVLGDGALCRLARDRLVGHWYLDGFYD
jgi:protein ImuB